jgi:hypothetical protein
LQLDSTSDADGLHALGIEATDVRPMVPELLGHC